MNSSGNIMRIIRPFIKAWPIIFIFLVGGVCLGFYNVYYAVPTYQTFSTLQINDKESGASTFLKKFETFSVIGQLLTEVEVLRSKYLIHKTLDKMNIQTTHFRYYRSKPRNLYKKSPFKVDYSFQDSSFYNRHFQFMLNAEEEFVLKYMNEAKMEVSLEGRIGEKIKGEGFEISVLKDEEYLKAHPDAFNPDHYGFTVNSKRSLVDKYSNKDLVVSLPDENVSIVKLYFTSEVPELAADFVNTLAETYIEDFVDSKSGTASKALNFIDEQIEKVEKELQQAEDTLAKYKVKTQVVDLAMETDAKLKRIGELEIRKLTLELEQTELQDLLSYLNTDTISYELNPNYESIEDPAFTDAILKLNTFKSSKKELLQQYTLEHPEVIKVNDELNRTKSFLVNSVQNTLSTNQAKIASLSASIRKVNGNFSKLPEIERDMMMLKRRFATQEQVYAFLLEKRAEAAIGAASTISFHKILERAPIPKASITPQKSLILGLSGFIGIILSGLMIFLYNYMRATVFYPADIELNTEILLLSQIQQVPSSIQYPSQDFINLATQMHLIKDTRRVAISTYGPKEGKNEVSLYMAQALASIGYKTLYIDLDFYHPFLAENFELEDKKGVSELITNQESLSACIKSGPIPNLDFLATGEAIGQIPTSLILNPSLSRILDDLSQKYDRVIIQTPYLKEVRDAIPLMRLSDLSILVCKADKTRIQHLKQMEYTLRRFRIEDLYAILLKEENQSLKKLYSFIDKNMAPMGKGSRRKMLRDVMRVILYKELPDGNDLSFPKNRKGNPKEYPMVRNQKNLKKMNRKSACIFLCCILFISNQACTPQWLFQNKTGYDMDQGIPIMDEHEHIIQMDDKITISVWGHDELGVGSSFSVYSSTLEQGKYISIDKSGEITLPLIGKVKLEGLTAREADLYIRQLYSKYVKNPIVYLRVLSHSVTVLGEVASPGNYLIDKQQKSLLELIGDAGGFSKYANKKQIKILRKHPDGELEEMEIDLTDVETLYNTDLALRSRDIIYIPERRSKEMESLVSGKIVPIVGVLGSIALIYSLTKPSGNN